MTLAEITKNSAIFTDENFSVENILSLANRAISRINVECKTLFPFYESTTAEYTAIPAMHQFDMISPYLSYGIKMNDSSLSETDRMVMGLIISLTLKNTYCYASNEYLEKYINKSQRTINYSLSKLKKLEYIKVKFENGKKKNIFKQR